MNITPDLVVLHANIKTMADSAPTAQAFAVKQGYIAAVGSDEEISELASPSTRVVDAGGKTVTPGFIDAHCHLLSLRGKQLLQADCSASQVASIDDVIRILRERAQQTPKGEWVLGGSFDFSKTKENRYPTRWELDKVSSEHPVHLRAQTCHIGIVNSKALEVAGITRDVEDPPGGVFDRDENGELTGVCREEAHFLFVTGMGKEGSFVPPYSLEEMKQAIVRSCREYNSMGITSVGDALVGPEEIEAYQAAYHEGVLNARVYMIVLDTNLEKLKQVKVKTGFGNDMLKIGGIKSFVDGAIAGHTAWLSRPYEDKPDYYGIPTKTPEEINQIVWDAHTAGFQLEVHANGDKAIEMLLDAYEKAQKEFPRTDPRHRIAHCTVITPEIIRRIKALGVVVLPFSTYVYEHGEKMSGYGDRISMMFAHRTFLDEGIPVGGSSDNPCATQDPLIAIQSMVTRKSSTGLELGPEQKVSVDEALYIYTRGSAYATFEEEIKGSIEAGKCADFVVLSDDPGEVEPETIKDIQVEQTFVGGRQVYP